MKITIEVPAELEDNLAPIMKDIISLKLVSHMDCLDHNNIIFTCVTDDNFALTINRAKCIMDSYQKLHDQLHDQTIEYIIMDSLEQATLETIVKTNSQQLH